MGIGAASNTPQVERFEKANAAIPLEEYQLRAYANNAAVTTLYVFLPFTFVIAWLAASTPPLFFWLWTAFFISAQCTRIFHSVKIGTMQPSKMNTRLHTKIAITIISAYVFVWASLFWLSSIYLNLEHQVIVMMIVVVMMVGSSISFFPIRKAAIPYSAIMGISVTMYAIEIGFDVLYIGLAGAFWVAANALRLSITFDADVRTRKQLIAERDKVDIALQEHSNSPVWLWSTDDDLNLDQLSQGAMEFFGSAPEKIFGTNFFEAIFGYGSRAKMFAPAGLKAVYVAMQMRRTVESEVIPLIGSDSIRWFLVGAEPKTDMAGNFSGYKGLFRDITIAQHRSASSIPIDYQTGLRQTPALIPHLSEDLIGAAIGRETIAILAISCTPTEHAMRRHGDRGGLELMKQTARSLGEKFEASDLSVYDSDTFMVLLHGWGHVDRLEEIAKEARELVCRPLSMRGIRIQSDIRVAVCAGPTLSSSPQLLIQNVLHALGNAAASGPPVVKIASNQRLGDGGHQPDAANNDLTPVYSAVLSTDSGALTHILTNISGGKGLSGQLHVNRFSDYTNLFADAISSVSALEEVKLLFPLIIGSSKSSDVARAFLNICRSGKVEPSRIIMLLSADGEEDFSIELEQTVRQLKMAGFGIFCSYASLSKANSISSHIDGILVLISDLSSKLEHRFPRNCIIRTTNEDFELNLTTGDLDFGHIVGNELISHMPATEIIALGQGLERTIKTNLNFSKSVNSE